MIVETGLKSNRPVKIESIRINIPKQMKHKKPKITSKILQLDNQVEYKHVNSIK
jgi:hypothetical protein